MCPQQSALHLAQNRALEVAGMRQVVPGKQRQREGQGHGCPRMGRGGATWSHELTAVPLLSRKTSWLT